MGKILFDCLNFKIKHLKEAVGNLVENKKMFY